MGKTSDLIKTRIEHAGGRYWAGDNIASYLHEGDKEALIEELTRKFEGVIDSLIIDRANDPNSQDTPRRLAKMYIKELMAGRYDLSLMQQHFLIIQVIDMMACLLCAVNLRVCVHTIISQWQVLRTLVLLPLTLIGLSKYTRLAQWCARRGTLQEELAMDICKEIQHATGSEDVGVYVQATHGCCENRGIMATSSLTQTTVLRGSFFTDGATKKEFMDNIKLQQSFVCK